MNAVSIFADRWRQVVSEPMLRLAGSLLFHSRPSCTAPFSTEHLHAVFHISVAFRRRPFHLILDQFFWPTLFFIDSETPNE